MTIDSIRQAEWSAVEAINVQIHTLNQSAGNFEAVEALQARQEQIMDEADDQIRAILRSR